jgi:hypothetical protein
MEIVFHDDYITPKELIFQMEKVRQRKILLRKILLGIIAGILLFSAAPALALPKRRRATRRRGISEKCSGWM